MLSIAKINPDGYNIILQGDIVHFVEMSGKERRGIIEEIGGISTYEEKRQKSLRVLEGVEEKLREVEIIMTERATYLKELKKERDQAQKFKDLQEQIQENKASYLNVQIKQKEEKAKDVNDKINKSKEIIEKINKEYINTIIPKYLPYLHVNWRTIFPKGKDRKRYNLCTYKDEILKI